MKARARLLWMLACGVPVGAAIACASSPDDTGLGLPDGSTGPHGDSATATDGTGPAPDAVVFGEAGAPDVGADVPLGGKTCADLADGTPCGPAPSECVDEPVCKGGTCAPPQAKADGITCGGGAGDCTNQGTCMAGACEATPKADGTVCAMAGNVCQTNGTCTGGTCSGVGMMPDGTSCGSAPDSCHAAPVCRSGQCAAPANAPDGTGWNASDPSAICCSGAEVEADTMSNCGACGIACNPNNGESCALLGGIYFCRGCVASDGCWSHCCSTSFTPYSCAASDCAGNCSSQYCPSGTQCVEGAPDASDYCSY